MIKIWCAMGLVLAAMASQRAGAEFVQAEHPFLLWNAEDLAAMRKRIETEPWAKKAYEQMLAEGPKGQGDEMRNLFRFAVMGDEAAGLVEKRNLTSLLKAPDPLGGSLEYRILAYDLLYNSMTPAERQDIEAMFRRYITYSIKPGGAFDASLFNDKANYSRYDGEEGKYTKTNWLPNIIFPRKLSANLMAVALRDEKLIRECWATHGSVKWYFDDYLSDWGFYQEEFSKMLPTPGTLLLYGSGLRRLGLDELGFGYKGAHGATYRGHLLTVLDLTYPMVDVGSTRGKFCRITAGDARGVGPFQQTTVDGYLPDGSGGNELFRPAGAWGGTTRGNSEQWDNDKTEKMSIRLWFEWGHKLWPDAGFDYFLVQMRAPTDDLYFPTLYFNIDPIDPSRVKTPEAKSWIAPERGVAMLRATEGADYWKSPAPAVAFRLPSPYAHHVNDPLTLSGFFAFNRPIYLNPHINATYAFKFSRSIRSHAGVMVDGQVPARNKDEEWGQTGSAEPVLTNDYTHREAFGPLAKFVAARSSAVYPGVDQTRALMLTRDYLFDVFANRSEAEHSYIWLVHALGEAKGDGDWQPSNRLGKVLSDLSDVRATPASGDWSASIVQVRPATNPAVALPDSWWQRQVGVRIRMIGIPDATAYLARTPGARDAKDQERQPPSIEMSSAAVSVQGKSATFVALHEAFENNAPAIDRYWSIAGGTDGVMVGVAGKGTSLINDRLMIALGDLAEKPLKLGDGQESCTFTGQAFLRIGAARVEAEGNIQALRMRVAGTPVLVINGKAVEAKVEGGWMVFGE